MISARQRSVPAVPSLVLPVTEKTSEIRASCTVACSSCNRKTASFQTSVLAELSIPATEKPSAVRHQWQLNCPSFFLQQKNHRPSDIRTVDCSPCNRDRHGTVISSSYTVASSTCNRKTVGFQTSLLAEPSNWTVLRSSSTEKSSAVRHQCQLHRRLFFLQ